MKKLLATTLLVLVCVSLPMLFIQADPGVNGVSGSTASTDSTTVNSQYGPVPPGYEGIWPPPDYMTSSTDTTGGGDNAPPYEDPDQ